VPIERERSMEPSGPNELSVYRVVVNDPREGKVALLTFLPPEDLRALGGLPGPVIVGKVPLDSKGLEPDELRVNGAFLALFHRVVRDTVPRIEEFREAVHSVDDAWLEVLDQRAVHGSDPDPENVIGVHHIRNGEFVIDDYRPNPEYKVLSRAGMMRPHPVIARAMLDAMRNLPPVPGSG
jgi:hypothetical protein